MTVTGTKPRTDEETAALVALIVTAFDYCAIHGREFVAAVRAVIPTGFGDVEQTLCGHCFKEKVERLKTNPGVRFFDSHGEITP